MVKFSALRKLAVLAMVFCSLFAKAWEVQTQITHTTIGNATGSISLQAAPDTGTFYYYWNTSDTGALISNLAAGSYACTIVNGSDTLVKSFAVGYYTTWDTLVKTTSPANGGITCTGAGSFSVDGYAHGLNTLRSNESGWWILEIAQGDTFQGSLGFMGKGGFDNISNTIGIGMVLNYLVVGLPGESPVFWGVYTPGNGYRFKIHFTSDSLFLTKYETNSGGAVTSSALWFALQRSESLSPAVYPFTQGSRIAATACSFACSEIRLRTVVEPGAKTDSTASIHTIVKGGTPPYNYLWSNSATTASLNDVAAGVYGLTVTDDSSATEQATTFAGIYVSWDTLIQVTEGGDNSLSASGSAIMEGFSGIAFSKNGAKAGQDFNINFDWNQGGDYMGMIGFINNIEPDNNDHVV